MFILIYSTRFYPQIGGIETVAMQLATSFSSMGHRVIVITGALKAKSESIHEFPFALLRNPSLFKRTKYAAEADVILHNSISLKALIPDVLFAKKFFIIHHTWYGGTGLKEKIVTALKLGICNFARNVYISNAIQKHVGKPGKVIPNPYNERLFKRNDRARRYELVFLGRLVSDKGCDLLLQALKILKKENVRLVLTIIGDGPEKIMLQNMAAELGLKRQIRFRGKLEGKTLADELNEHHIMVVPSVWNEPFGVVALEGLACGCYVIGSDGGGLREAIGPGGVTFRKGIEKELAACIKHALLSGTELDNAAINRHLARHSSSAIAGLYINYFKEGRA